MSGHDDSSALRLTALGPIIINSDGTTSRIANYASMTPEEQQNTLRMIGLRNKKRLAELRAQGVEVKYDGDVGCCQAEAQSAAGETLRIEDEEAREAVHIKQQQQQQQQHSHT